MTAVKKIGGDYYLVRSNSRRIGYYNFYNWFPVRAVKDKGGAIYSTECISVPDELVGKRVRLKVEVVE